MKKTLFVLLPSLFLLSCSHFNNTNSSAPTARAIWVQDTLSHKNIGFRKVNRMTPVLTKNKIIVGSGNEGLVAYELPNHQEVWRKKIPYGVEASAALINDRLFVPSNSGHVYSIDTNTGDTQWTFDTKSEAVGEPFIDEGVLYFITESQAVFALDASNGRQLWTYNRQDTTNLMTIRGGSKPSISNGILYVGFSDGSLVALNSKTGTQQWEILLNRNTKFRDIDASPVIDKDFIYINSYDDHLYCISKNKGEIIWKSKLGGYGTPLLMGEYIISTSSKGDLTSLKKVDGTIVWQYKTNNGIVTDPVLMRGLVVAGESQGSLLFLDALTGKLKASFEPGRGILSKPTINLDKNLAYFISGEANVYGVEFNNSSLRKIDYLK